MGGGGVAVVLEPVLGTGHRKLVAELVFAIDELPDTNVHGSDVISTEVDDLLQHGGKLEADGGVDVREEAALYAGEDTVPGHAGDHVNVHGMLSLDTWRGQGQDLGGLTSASSVAHVQEHLLRSKQRRLHTVLVKARILANTPKLLPIIYTSTLTLQSASMSKPTSMVG